MTQYKTCSRCKQTLTRDSFYKDPRSKDGLLSRCKICNSEVCLIYKQANREKLSQYQKQRYRRDREAIKANQRNRYANDATYRQNQNESYKKWAIENRETSNRRKRLWAQDNPNVTQAKDAARRQREKGAKRYLVLAKEIKRLRQGPCFYCGSKKAMITIDHVIPLARGGSHSIGNLVGACKSCNSSKGAKTITEWKKVRRSL